MKKLAAAGAAITSLPEIAQALDERVRALRDDVLQTADDAALWRRVRKEFALNPGLVHFNCGSIGAMPRVVIDAVCGQVRRYEANPYDGAFDNAVAVRKKAADFLGAAIDEVALTRNTTEGMDCVATGLHLKEGDEVLTTNHEHGGGMICWQYLVKHHDVRMRYLKLPKIVKDTAQILELVEQNITERTRACSFSHVDTITGMQMPLAAISALTRPKGILLICDGAQGPGMLDVDVKALGVDTYASSSHKWMLAPRGSGLLYIRKEVQDRVQPVMFHQVSGEGQDYNAYGASSGTRNMANIHGHGVAMDFHNAIGRARIEGRCRALSRLVRERLRAIPALTLLTPEQEELSSAIVSFALDPARGKNSDIVTRFREEYNTILKAAQGTLPFVPAEHVPPPH
ncbi:MAG: hypothetical protein CMM31_10540, partial [Rhodospirillaceae bacterium]|nr:hypothetical protein [Rhodospirillaceae bacterium]